MDLRRWSLCSVLFVVFACLAISDDPCSVAPDLQRLVQRMRAAGVTCQTEFTANRDTGSGPELFGAGDRLELEAWNGSKKVFAGGFTPWELTWHVKILKAAGCSAIWFHTRTAGSQCCSCSYYIVPGACSVNIHRIQKDEPDDATLQSIVRGSYRGSSSPCTAVNDDDLRRFADNAQPTIRRSINENLFAAASAGELDEVRTLLQQGADPNFSRGPRAFESVLYLGMFNVDLLKILLHAGAKPRRFPGMLVTACSRGRADVAHLLLDAGADVNDAFPDSRDTCIMEAACNTDLLRYLLQSRPEVNATNAGGFTALMKAATCRNLASVQLLIAAGADKTRRNQYGKNAEDLAAGWQTETPEGIAVQRYLQQVPGRR